MINIYGKQDVRAKTTGVPRNHRTAWEGRDKNTVFFCAQRADDGIVRFGRKPWCATRPSCGVEGRNVLYCSQHAMSQVDIHTKICEHDGSTKNPSYVSKVSEFCAQHVKVGIINVRAKRCIHEGRCTRCPSFSVEGGKTANFCRQHAKNGMMGRPQLQVRARRVHEGAIVWCGGEAKKPSSFAVGTPRMGW